MKLDITKSGGFDAVARSDARVLILGTLPGGNSLQRGEYYAQPRNAFWPIMNELVGASPSLSYADRTLRLVEKGIALWDVCLAGNRAGSLDSAIQLSSVVPNDFNAFLDIHTGIRLICFNGVTAAEIFRRKVLASLPAAARLVRREVLPSSSPASTSMTLEQKLRCWRLVSLALTLSFFAC